MIKRIVKLTLKEEAAEPFEGMFQERKELIRAFPGCQQLELIREVDKAVFFTISIWNDPSDLENYRNSELFKSTWSKVKPMFADRAQAWTTKSLEFLP